MKRTERRLYGWKCNATRWAFTTLKRRATLVRDQEGVQVRYITMKHFNDCNRSMDIPTFLAVSSTF